VLTNKNQDQRWLPENAGNVLCAKVAQVVYEHFAKSKPTEEASGLKPGEERLVIGPFLLGDLYERYDNLQRRGDAIWDRAGLKKQEVIEALNECKIHILDKRTKESGKWRFTGTDHTSMIEGKLSWTFKNKDGKVIKMNVKEVKLAVSHLDYTVTPPIKDEVGLNPGIEFSPALDDGTLTTYFVPPTFAYDINGKVISKRK